MNTGGIEGADAIDADSLTEKALTLRLARRR